MPVVSPRRSTALLCLVATCSFSSARTAVADSVTWIAPTSGLWTTSTNWSSDPALPDPTSDVTINQPAPLTVTLSSGNQSINSLVLDNSLTLSTGGSLAVAFTLQVAGTFTLAGGTLQNATLSTLAPGNITLTTGTLNNVTIASDLAVTNPALTLSNNLMLAGANITLAATTAASVSISGNETLSGTGAIIFNGTRSSSILGAAGALTIASGILFETGSASGNFQVNTLVNQGTIAAQLSGKTISINSATFTNAGTLQASNGGTLTINSANWTSPGSISLDTTSTLNLGGAFGPAILADVSRTGGALNITGILDNSNNTLALAPASTPTTLLGGTLKNGNLSLAGGTQLTVSTSGTLAVNALTVGAGGTLLQNAGTLTVPTITQSGGTISLGGTQPHYTLNNLTLCGGATTLTADAAKTLATTALTFAGTTDNWTGQFEIGANKLIVNPTAMTKATTLATLQNQVLYGATHAAGITSSGIPATMEVAVVDNAALPTPFTSFGGQPVTTASLLISRELLGDTDLSGTVDLNDLNTVLNSLGTISTGWTSGGFDGQSTIDLNDLNDVLNHLGASSSSVLMAGALVGTALPTVVPEPAALLLISLGALPLIVRRRIR